MHMTLNRRRPAAQALTAMTVGMSMMMPLLGGCGNDTSRVSSNARPQYDTTATRRAPGPYSGGQQQQNRGMSTGQKVAILAGAAALYYLYNKHKNAKGTGPNGQYYRSKNGRIYYRDEKGNAVYVSPPAGGIQVPAEEAERYNRAAQSGDWGMIENGGMGSGSRNGSGDFGYSAGAPGAGGDLRGGGSYGGSNYGAPYGGDRGNAPVGAGSGMQGGGGYGGGGSSVPPGPGGRF